jgi:type II secretory pathway component PulK
MIRSRVHLPPAVRALHGERGLALPLAMLVVMILSAITLELALTSTAEFGDALATARDLRAGYLAQAGIEHQIYLLKANKDAGPIGLTNYPVTPGRDYWYSTTLQCLLSCGANFETRRWQLVATGEIHQAGSATVLQTRSIRALVEIHYGGTGSALFQIPTQVLVLRWEEVYP